MSSDRTKNRDYYFAYTDRLYSDFHNKVELKEGTTVLLDFLFS